MNHSQASVANLINCSTDEDPAISQDRVQKSSLISLLLHESLRGYEARTRTKMSREQVPVKQSARLLQSSTIQNEPV